MTVDAAEVFEAQRGRLFGLAYRLLGSASDAEDVLQDAFLRWNAADRDAIATPAAWLTTVVTNLCLTELTSARQRRERYTGTWLPEPVLTGADGDGTGTAVATAVGLGPLETAAQRESVSMALLLLCEQLTAPERAVFILHEAFGYRYGEIADIIGRSEPACRQLGHRAAVRLKAESRSARSTPADPAEASRWRQLTGQFLAAATAGDLAGLEGLLADDVVSYSDGGGKVPAGLRPVRGRAKVARLFAALGPALVPGAELGPALAHALGGVLREGLEASEAEVNGSPAILLWTGGELFAVFVPVIDGEKISALYGIANPDKLAIAGRQARVSRADDQSRHQVSLQEPCSVMHTHWEISVCRPQRVKDSDRPGLWHITLGLVNSQPCHLGRLVGRMFLTGNETAAEGEGHDPAIHVLVDARQPFSLNLKAGFLENFAGDTVGRRLGEFEYTTRWYPAAVVAAPGQRPGILTSASTTRLPGW